jgi:ABC-type transport system involved in cytochrome c biogenesis permease subunit
MGRPLSGSPRGTLSPPRWLSVLLPVAILALAGAQAFGFLASPPDRDMGHLQKIMYVHVPAAWMAMIAFFVGVRRSILYLWRRQQRYDLFAARPPRSAWC